MAENFDSLLGVNYGGGGEDGVAFGSSLNEQLIPFGNTTFNN